MEDGKRREVRKLLTALEAQREQDRFAEREIVLEKNRQLYRFQEMKKTVLLPTLRELMTDLDRKGHLTRLQEVSPEKVRLDVQVQTQTPKRGAIEFSLDKSDAGKVKVNYGWVSDDTKFDQEIYPLEFMASSFVVDRILHLLRGLM